MENKQIPNSIYNSMIILQFLLKIIMIIQSFVLTVTTMKCKTKILHSFLNRISCLAIIWILLYLKVILYGIITYEEKMNAIFHHGSIMFIFRFNKYLETNKTTQNLLYTNIYLKLGNI